MSECESQFFSKMTLTFFYATKGKKRREDVEKDEDEDGDALLTFSFTLRHRSSFTNERILSQSYTALSIYRPDSVIAQYKYSFCLKGMLVPNKSNGFLLLLLLLKVENKDYASK